MTGLKRIIKQKKIGIMNKKIEILVSVDDGNVLDMELAEVLLKYNIPAVFYIAPSYSDLQAHQIKCLSGTGNCELSKDMKGLFEIGSHTMTHPVDMKVLTDKELKYEVFESKKYLEMLLQGKEVSKFCYPKGKFDDRVKKAVKKAGYKMARTTRQLSTELPKDMFEVATSVHAHGEKYHIIDDGVPERFKDKTWVEVGYALLDNVLTNGGKFELFCHSWEIEKYNSWEFLESFLAYMDEVMERIKYPRRKL